MLKRTSKQLSMFSSLEDMLSHEHPLSNLVIRLIGNVLKMLFLLCIAALMVALPILFAWCVAF